MKDRPIIMSAPMVLALLSGQKTQTRRGVKPSPKVIHADYGDGRIYTERSFRHGDGYIHCPYGQPGDRLWVRESGYLDSEKRFWAYDATPNTYCESDNPGLTHWCQPAETPTRESLRKQGWVRKPSIFMPRWACRILLDITSVRVESLQDITEADCIDEGIQRGVPNGYLCPKCGGRYISPVNAYHCLWEHIHGKCDWEGAPIWVWRVEFRRVDA